MVPDAVKPLPRVTLSPCGCDIVGVTTPVAWMLLPTLIASNPATPVKFGIYVLALLFNVVCKLVPLSVFAGVDKVPVTVKSPLPLSCAICGVPPNHLKLYKFVFIGILFHNTLLSIPIA